jgi:hypothetical protein
VAEVSYAMVKDQYFFYNSATDWLLPESSLRKFDNTFDWLYDDVNILKLSGEILHAVSDNFSIHLIGNYYSYDLKEQTNAWQMPDYDFTFSGVYRPVDQLKFTADVFLSGGRKGLIMNLETWENLPVKNEIIMDPVIDLNAGVDYQFNDKLNFFFKLNNFGFQKYEQWLGYTNKSFNWLAGISYSF